MVKPVNEISNINVGQFFYVQPLLLQSVSKIFILNLLLPLSSIHNFKQLYLLFILGTT